MQERHTNYGCYFRESEESCLKYYLPYLGEYIPSLFENSPKAFEVGCVLGGNLVPFARKDCSVCGVDIDPLSINWAKNLYLNPHYEMKFGLKPRILWEIISGIPYIRDFFSTSCHYLIRRRA